MTQPSGDNYSSNNNSKNGNKILTILLLIALSGTWTYLLWDKNREKGEKRQMDELMAATSGQRDQLQKELEDATMRYDEIKTSSSKKDSTISVKDIEINEKKNKITNLLSKINASGSELKEAKRLIMEMNSDIDGYKKQIELLEGQKLQLTHEKETVTGQRDQLSKEYDSARRIINDRENVIDIGSTLHASRFNIFGIKEKSSGKEKETGRAKRVDKLRIEFDLDENLITTSGTKKLFIIITDPTTNAIYSAALGSGTFTTRDAQEKKYTQQVDVNYIQNQRQKVSFDWRQDLAFIKGNYKIEVYNNGFKIGEASIPLK